ELGGEAGHAALREALAAAGLGQVLDIVPNHMAIGAPANRWWWEVLKHGADSRYARYFDVDWDPPESKLRNKVLLPVLGDHYGRVLDAGELVVEQQGDEHVVRYHEHVFPLTGEPRDDLDAWLEDQHYRLAFWRTAGRELDYRRFFDITTLIGLRVEDAEVFADTHRRIIEWVHDRVLDGLRVDHPDGLRDPEGYLHLLHGATDGPWIVVEKILEHGEQLPSTWPVAGTTGYDFLNLVGGLFVDPQGEEPLTEAYAELTGEKTDWHEVAVEKKLLVLREVLAADLIRLAHLFVQVCERHPRYRDYTRHELTDVLREVIASFPVYRTYVRPREGVASDADRRHIEAAIAGAVARRPDLDTDLVAFVRRLLLGELPEEYELVERFQQLTGPVMAKGVEDTAFYTFNRLVCLNEVGGDPGRFGTSVEEFHRWCLEHDGSHGLLATSTHDTKRGEDVRARIAVLSEVPEQWAAFARRWVRHGAVDANAQYLLLQTLVGAWPISVERAAAYMEKATKEAKVHTSWTDPDPDYDAAARALVEEWLGHDAFVADIGVLVDLVRERGRVNSLAQTLLLLTAPGVPDIYQGTELWDDSLVDPDNRRPVDYEERRRLLASGDHPKLRVITTALRAGVSGEYRPLPSDDRTVAFARGDRHVVAVPRLGGPVSFEVPPGEWHDLLDDLPVSLFERAERGS
ncbi:MAG: malto-oligosyltrehalose synthase, partial [Actinomycetota bacterium]|nr:malto-oligosyltrehalose synthase [Actinomycetota bacterium]